ncbi:hypothetical protein LEP1GSC089_1957 [Leptospira interrogans serovar Autumnalis str. LP101]|nr:hypothetical protein LEP1GSC080_0086 [Leptospira interrogans str. FPW2026]EMN53636.1 hypothetical protein LEP1GSC089_1957 [Leptospira interrogans serovar Autumnalis str. LP101]
MNLSCEIQTEKVEPKTYMDLTEAIQNPLDVRVLNLDGEKLTTLPKEIGQLKKLRWLFLDANLILPKELKRIPKRNTGY